MVIIEQLTVNYNFIISGNGREYVQFCQIKVRISRQKSKKDISLCSRAAACRKFCLNAEIIICAQPNRSSVRIFSEIKKKKYFLRFLKSKWKESAKVRTKRSVLSHGTSASPFFEASSSGPITAFCLSEKVNVYQNQLRGRNRRNTVKQQ